MSPPPKSWARRLRSGALTLAFAVAGLAPAVRASDAPAVEHSLGSPSAPVTVIEYASVGCPHCATWANTVFPAFKARYVDTGKARYVFREMLTGDPELAAAGFLIADCAAPDKYFQVVDAIFADQAGVVRGGAPALLKIAGDAGLTTAQFQACLTNEAALKSLEDRTDLDAKDHGVEATPTFFIAGKKLTGDVDLDALGAAIAQARR